MIEFIKETHTYLVDGIVTPSVSTILKATIFENKYQDVPEAILKNAAEFGTAIHDAIEHNDPILLDDTQHEVYERWVVLKEKNNIEPVEQEQMIHYEQEYAGTFDMIANIKGNKCLVDIKTTYNLDKEYLSWQLSMYALAKGHDGDLYAVWLPKRKKAQLVKIERKEPHQIQELLEVYYALQKHNDELYTQW
jgi:hypothetical protein